MLGERRMLVGPEKGWDRRRRRRRRRMRRRRKRTLFFNTNKRLFVFKRTRL